MGVVFRTLAFVAAMAAVLLPHRHWRRFPSWMPMESAAFLSGLATVPRSPIASSRRRPRETPE